MQIQITKSGQGISQAIKLQLQKQGIDVSKMDASVWNQILTSVAEQNEALKSSGQTPLFSGGSDINGATNKNFVVHKGQTLNFGEALWNTIVGAVTGRTVSQTGNVSQTAATSSVSQTSSVADKEAIESTKAGCASDLAAFSAAGVKVSDWDKNNTCTLSHDGKNATIHISNSGEIEFGGDFEYMANLLTAKDPSQQESVDAQETFLNSQEAKGDPIVGNPKMTKITVNGEEISVNEYTTQNGNKYYLDNNGNQVTPD